MGEAPLISALLWVACAFGTAAIFEDKRRPTLAGFALGLFFGPVGLLIAVGLEKAGSLCWSCREVIHPKASVCPWCGREDPTLPTDAERRRLQRETDRRRGLETWIFVALVLAAIGAAVWYSR